MPAALLELAERVDEAGLDQGAEPGAFLRGEPVVLHVRLRIRQVDLGVGHVQVAADDDGFGLFQLLEIREEVPVPLLAIGQAGEFAPGVGHVDVDEVERGELRRQHPALVVVLQMADAAGHFERGGFREDGGAGITLLLRPVPVGGQLGRPGRFDVVRVALGFLEAKDVGRFAGEELEEVLLQHGAQPVDVP